MEFSFIDNSPTNESERPEVTENFTNYIDRVLVNTPMKNTETNTASFNTQKIEVKQGDLTLTIQKQFFKNKPTRADESQFEDLNYEIGLRVSRFSNGRNDSHDEIYKFTKNNAFAKFVERMTSRMCLDGTTMSHNTEKHEIGKTELAEMLQFISNILAEKKHER